MLSHGKFLMKDQSAWILFTINSPQQLQSLENPSLNLVPNFYSVFKTFSLFLLSSQIERFQTGFKDLHEHHILDFLFEAAFKREGTGTRSDPWVECRWCEFSHLAEDFVKARSSPSKECGVIWTPHSSYLTKMETTTELKRTQYNKKLNKKQLAAFYYL